MKKTAILPLLTTALLLSASEFVIQDTVPDGMGLEQLFFKALEAGTVQLPDNLEIAIRKDSGARTADVIAAELAPGEAPPEGLCAARVARYPVIVAVSTKNPIRGLSAEAVRKIFNGRTTSWEQISPLAGSILRVGFREKTPQGRAFRRFIMLEDVPSGQPPPPGHEILPGIIWLEAPEHAKAFQSADTVILFGGWELTAMPGFKALEIDKIAPTRENVASGRYRFALDHLLLYRKEAPPEALDAVVNYLHAGALRNGAFDEKSPEAPVREAKAPPAPEKH